MKSYCLKCKKDTENINPRVPNISNRKTMLFPLKNLSTIPTEFQWNSTGVVENYWKMTGTNGNSGIPLKFRWNSSSS